MDKPPKVPLWFFLLFIPTLFFLPTSQAWNVGTLLAITVIAIYLRNRRYYGWWYWNKETLTESGAKKFEVDSKKEGVGGYSLTLAIILLLNIVLMGFQLYTMYIGVANPPLASIADLLLWTVLSLSAGIALLVSRKNALLILALFLAYDFLTNGASYLILGAYDKLPLLVLETSGLVVYLLYSSRVRNTYSLPQWKGHITAIVVAAAVVSWLLLATQWDVVSLRDYARYEFLDENNNTFDGNVWTDHAQLGSTSKGLIYLEKIQSGNVTIETRLDDRPVNITFLIGKEDEVARHMYLTANLSDHSVSAFIQPYMDAIRVNDPYLRSVVISATEDCRSKECRAAYLFDFVTRNMQYLSDPRNREHIQTPNETLELGAGDCEDLSILLTSLFESSGIETKMVFTDDHAYALVCGLDENRLSNYTQEVLTRVILVEENAEYSPIGGFEGEWYGNYTNYTAVYYNISLQSNKPLHVIAFVDHDNMSKWWLDEEYYYYDFCSYEEIEELEVMCTLTPESIVEIYNPNFDKAQVRRNIKIYGVAPPTYYNGSLTKQDAFGETCIVMDPSGGKGSYIGYDNNITTRKYIADPLTKAVEVVE